MLGLWTDSLVVLAEQSKPRQLEPRRSTTHRDLTTYTTGTMVNLEVVADVVEEVAVAEARNWAEVVQSLTAGYCSISQWHPTVVDVKWRATTF